MEHVQRSQIGKELAMFTKLKDQLHKRPQNEVEAILLTVVRNLDLEFGLSFEMQWNSNGYEWGRNDIYT